MPVNEELFYSMVNDFFLLVILVCVAPSAVDFIREYRISHKDQDIDSLIRKKMFTLRKDAKNNGIK